MTLNIDSLSVMNAVYREDIRRKDTFSKRYEIYYGGSGSGKSVYVTQKKIIKHLKYSRCNILILRKIADTNRFSTIPEIEKTINKFGLKDYFKITKNPQKIVNLLYGNEILFGGLDDVEKMKSVTFKNGILTDIWVEEATEITEKDFENLDIRLRGISDVPLQITLSFNPINQLHWLYKRFFMSNDEYINTNKYILKTTYLDNKFIDSAYRNKLESYKDSDPYMYQVYTLGNFGVLGNVIFKNWEVRELSEEEKTFNNFRYGLDWGYNDPFCVIKTAINTNRKEIYIYDEIYQRGIETNKQIAELLKVFVRNNYVVCDSSEPKSINEIKAYGIKALPTKKGKDSVVHGIKWLKQFKIVINPKCQSIINEFQLYKWREDRLGNSLEIPVDANNHAIDSLRYAYEDMMTLSSGGLAEYHNDYI